MARAASDLREARLSSEERRVSQDLNDDFAKMVNFRKLLPRYKANFLTKNWGEVTVFLVVPEDYPLRAPRVKITGPLVKDHVLVDPNTGCLNQFVFEEHITVANSLISMVHIIWVLLDDPSYANKAEPGLNDLDEQLQQISL